MKTLTRIAICALLAISLPAAADFRTIERAYEVQLNQFRLPGASVGALALRPCNTCEVKVIRVTPETQYILNQEPLELKDFRKAIARVGKRDQRWVIVLHHLEKDTVTSVSLNLK